ncbi:VOC family protein [Streptomyces sp. NPDC127114]|uniref:VOC family protein n=1 Tax=Streptomyces sp. NPDC127114 TaxID=3345366 RepID=UPI00362AF921
MQTPPQPPQPRKIPPSRFRETPGLDDWRVLGEGACAYFRTGTFAAGARFVAELAALPETADRAPDVDVRPDGVTVRLVTVTDELYGLTEHHPALAQRISRLAADHGLVPDPSALTAVQVTVDALSIDKVTPFWRALLGYEHRAGSPEDLIDLRRRNAAFYFQQMDTPRPQRNRVHVDVWVPHDQAETRIAAALSAGGTLVTAAHAPSHWVLADPEGNEACVGTL